MHVLVERPSLGKKWLFFQLLVAQGGADTTQVYTPLTAYTEEDVDGSNDTVVNAVLELDAEAHIVCAPEVVERYKGVGELPSDVGMFRHVTTDGLIDAVLNHPYLDDERVLVASIDLKHLAWEWRHDFSDIYTVVSQTDIAVVKPKPISKSTKAAMTEEAPDDEGDDLTSLFGKRGAAVEASQASRNVRRTTKLMKSADPDPDGAGQDCGDAPADAAPPGTPDVTADADAARQSADAAVESMFELQPGSLSELFNGPDPDAEPGCSGLEQDNDFADENDSEAEEEEEDPEPPPPPPAPSGDARRPRARHAAAARPPARPDPRVASAMDVTVDEVCAHYGLELIEHLYAL